MNHRADPHPQPPRWAWVALLLGLMVVYLCNLGSLSLPSNGDEMVYSHIARRTAESGHWLPLVSDMPHMRNTKPPLLFWQAMVAGDWGAQWDLWRLRLPAVLHTLALALGLVWLARRLGAAPVGVTSPRPLTGPGTATGATTVGLMAGAFYLAFFSTLRYGRPYLTSGFETLWLCAPLGWVLLDGLRRQTSGDASPHRPSALPGWPAFVAIGLVWGVGLWFKSFALAVPAALGLGVVLLALYVPMGSDPAHTGRGLLRMIGPTLVAVTWRVALAGGVAVAVFALWFALDPEPAAVWREFIVGENMGKLATSAQPLSAKFMAVLVQALAPVENAGPLALVMFGGLLLALRGTWRLARRASVGGEHRLSLALAGWALVWVLLFCLPSQRSARYIIPAMPALAWLLALHAPRIARPWWLASAALGLPVVALLVRLSHAQHTLGIASAAEWWLAAALGLGTLAALAWGVWHSAWTRWVCAAVALGLYATLAAVLAPLGGAAGRFNPDANALPATARLALPSGFNQQHERYRFLLPAAGWHGGWQAVPYANAPDQLTPARLAELLAAHDAVVWSTPASADGAASLPPCAAASPDGTPPTCRVLASRWDVRTRHRPGDITAAKLWHPTEWAYAREWLLVRAPAQQADGAAPIATPQPPASAAPTQPR